MKAQFKNLLKIKFILPLICVSILLNLVLYLNSSTRHNHKKRDVINENDVKNDNDVTATKLYPDWVIANFSRESPFSRTLSRQFPAHSSWTSKEGKSPSGSVWPQPQSQQNDERRVRSSLNFLNKVKVSK